MNGINRVGLVVLLCAMMAVFCGCSANQQEQVQEQQTGTTTERVQEDSIFVTLYLYDQEQEQGENGQPASSNDGLTTTLMTAVDKDSLTAETIAAEYNQLVVQSQYDKGFVYNEIRTKDKQVWIDFDSEAMEAMDLEEGCEGMLFYNLARSITDNLETVEEVYITMDGGKDFRLRHLWFENSRPFYAGLMPLESEEGTSPVAPE